MFWLANLLILGGLYTVSQDPRLTRAMKTILGITLTASVMSAYNSHETHVHTHQILERYGVQFDENGKEINP